MGNKYNTCVLLFTVMDGSDEYLVDDPSENDIGDDDNPPAKRVKKPTNNASNINKRFQTRWLSESIFKGWLKAVPNDFHAAQCVACKCIIKGGRSEILKHSSREKHKKAVRDVQTSVPIDKSFAALQENTEKVHEDNVKKAEISIAAYFAEHNTSFLSCDHLVKVIKNAAKDSKIIEDVKLGRTKCCAIVKNVIAKTETEDLVKDLQQTVFSVMIDESTDISNDKNMCILVRYVSPSSRKLITTLLEIVRLDSHDCSAESLWQAFKKCLDEKKIPITNIVGFASDNASTMTGIRNSFWTRLKAECPWAVLLACICHSSAIISRDACSALPSFVEDVLKGIATYMNKSPKRCAQLKDFQVKFYIKGRSFFY